MSFARVSALLVLLVGVSTMANRARGEEAAIAIDEGNSSASFVVHMRLPMPAEGELTQVTGRLRGTPETGWEVLVKVDSSNLRFNGPRWMDRVTRSDSFLSVDKFPVIGFDSEQFSNAMLRTGGPLRGQLTLRGLTQPVSFKLLPSTCANPGRDCDIQVQGTISRHAFGMNAYRTLVKDNVDFHFRVRLHPATKTP
jgi:polyisoprenoid-binding protein YceI